MTFLWLILLLESVDSVWGFFAGAALLFLGMLVAEEDAPRPAAILFVAGCIFVTLSIAG